VDGGRFTPAAVPLSREEPLLHNAFMGDLKRYTVWLFKKCGEKRVIFTDDGLRVARRNYRIAIEEHPDRLIMLCDRSIV
jgi:hypothetical protein